jgi:hypothetical protein
LRLLLLTRCKQQFIAHNKSCGGTEATKTTTTTTVTKAAVTTTSLMQLKCVKV